MEELRYPVHSVVGAIADDGDSPFTTIDWFTLLENTVYSVDGQSAIFAAWVDDVLSVVLPLRSCKQRGGLPIRGLRSMSNYYTPVFSPLIDSSAAERGALAAVFRQLSLAQPVWHWLDLEPLSVESRDHLSALLLGNGFVVFPYFRFGNWYLPLEGRSYAEYAASLPSRLRNTLVRKNKQLNKMGRCDVRLFVAEQGVQSAIEAYWQVYNASWKQAEPYPAFIEGLISLAARQGWLRLGVLYIDNVPVATQLWLVFRGKAYVYKLAYDERFAGCSPGSVLSEFMFKQVIDMDGVVEIDYLVGDDSYKRDWMSARRERWGLLAFNRGTLCGRFLAANESVRRALRSRG
jgi:hypothetical protein